MVFTLNSALVIITFYEHDISLGATDNKFTFDFGVKKNILDNKGEISIAATDLFNVFEIRKTIFSYEITMVSENFSDTQVVTLEMKYKF